MYRREENDWLQEEAEKTKMESVSLNWSILCSYTYMYIVHVHVYTYMYMHLCSGKHHVLSPCSDNRV